MKRESGDLLYESIRENRNSGTIPVAVNSLINHGNSYLPLLLNEGREGVTG